jgi:hypothetical protein
VNHKLSVEINITDDDIRNIVITALEGGITYWGCLINEGDEFDKFYKDSKGISTSEFVANLLLSGGSVWFYDTELDFKDSDKWEFNLTLLLKGVKMYIDKSKDINFIDNLDSNVADHIFQYAMFDEIVYG